mmetsp:Transcript_62389/g.129502  ORF Transcript_62389/g.129502 Transcript_62389/m.129502 type:complete len:96 (+) Transcript_62389:2603-2890(+)
MTGSNGNGGLSRTSPGTGATGQRETRAGHGSESVRLDLHSGSRQLLMGERARENEEQPQSWLEEQQPAAQHVDAIDNRRNWRQHKRRKRQIEGSA